MTTVYVLGAKVPLGDGEQVVAAIISEAHRYYNNLIELARKEKAEKDEARRQHFVELPPIEESLTRVEQDIESIYASIRARNASTKRLTATADEREEIKRLKLCQKQIRLMRSSVLMAAENNPAYMAECERRHLAFNELRRALYERTDCNWGTKLWVAAQVERAVADATKNGIEPKFRRWTGDGAVAIQLQKGAGGTLAEIESPDSTKLRIERGQKFNRKQKCIVSLRTGTVEGSRTPIWLRIPALLDKNFDERFPVDGIVMWAVLIRRSGAPMRKSDGSWKPFCRYEIHLTVKDTPAKTPAASGVCGVDLGWRLMDDGSMRVAYWIGDDGQKGDVRLDISRWNQINDLQSKRGGKFEDARSQLVKWLTATRDKLSEEMQEASETIGQTRSAQRICRFVDLWGRNRIEGDDAIYRIMFYWREREAQLWQQELAMRRRATLWRLDVYRNLAAMLAGKYRQLVVEDCDWRKLNVLPASDKNEAVNETARRLMRIASVGMLRDIIDKSGALVAFAKTENTTKTCHKCGSIETWDQQRDLVHQCAACGVTWDQDENAGINLSASGKMMAKTPGAARENEDDDEGDGVSGVITNDPQGGPSGGGRWGRRKQEALARRQQKPAA